ncbi:hypothetical protein QBC46DRAFT_355536 [Diplogelasinospora grovesii]|uniref:Uncharacterized protein n=1 Tax=Diplogelasinospora grovesii TaxID=303347 RepID=A0AAN6S2N6_9PEZI|nr:hypothetical protein QBC46DRAFT_355536 [Diplogelasinospora grovesii]
MKLLAVLILLVGIAVALDLSERDGLRRPHKKASRPKKLTGPYTMRGASKPSNAPAAYKTGMDHCSRKRSKAALKKLPADLEDPATRLRRDSLTVLRHLRRQSTANDFYECTNANPAPADADCNVIIDQVLASGDSLVIAQNACLTFVYQTCEGFFCSLCDTLSTTTDFIGNQLDSAETLCVSQGQTGTIIGEDAPQWDAGFVYNGDSLPTYDVC